MLTAAPINGGTVDPRWWKEKDEAEMAESIFSIVSYLDKSQKYISSANLQNLRLYSNLDILGMNVQQYNQASSSLDEKLKLNLIAAVTDTLSAKISKNKPKPTFLTSGADWMTQRKAKKLDIFTQGLFYKDKTYEKGQQIFIDACVWGTGALKVYEHKGMPCSERVIIDELKVDMADAYYGKPRSLYQTKFINRDVLAEMYPDSAKQISYANAEKMNKFSFAPYGELTDQIKVIEAWHLPSGDCDDEEESKTDGFHTICIENAILFQEEWTKDHFPFVFFRLLPKLIGFWGTGVAEYLTAIQYELNKLLITLQASMHLVSIPRILKETSSAIVDAHLNNEIGSIVEYSGVKPEFWAGGGIPPELPQQILFLWQKGFEAFGMSQLSATSQKPAGLNAGVALREYNDIETERFVLIGQRYEQMYVEIADLFICQTEEIYQRDKKFTVKAPNKKILEDINWKDISLDREDYLIQIFPTSSLPTRPEGRLQTIQEMIQAGMIPPEDGMRLLDFPDLESYMDLRNADQNDIDMIIEHMLEKGEYQTPEPYQNLSFGVKRMQRALLKAKVDSVPEDRMELLLRWIEQANAMIDQLTAPELPQIDPAMANPMPTPQNELIPNVPNQAPPLK